MSVRGSVVPKCLPTKKILMGEKYPYIGPNMMAYVLNLSTVGPDMMAYVLNPSSV